MAIKKAVGRSMLLYQSGQPKRFTESLDAAVTLVPEGFVWGAETFCCNGAARVVGPEDAAGDVPQGYSDEVSTKTPAMALCAAALRARAAMEGK
jgi:hypothetical protein